MHEEENEHLTIVATGSEVSIALEAASKLRAQGIRTRVVSLPCWLVFDQQPIGYRVSVLRAGAPILSLEALSVRDQFSDPRIESSLTRRLQTAGWERYSHEQYGLKGWGSSGPYKKVYEKFGITGDSTLLSMHGHFSNLTISQTSRSLGRG